MDGFIKAIAGVLIATVLGLVLSRQGKDITALLTIAVCCMVITAAATYLRPVVEFFEKLESIGKLDSGMLTILLKAVGIGLLAEVTNLICADAGNAALGKTLQILASAVILWISIPLLTSLIDLVEEILGEI